MNPLEAFGDYGANVGKPWGLGGRVTGRAAAVFLAADDDQVLAAVEVGEGRAILNIFRSKPVQDGFALRVIERHPLGSQAFMPLSPYPYAVVVAPPGDFDPTALRAFLASPAQGVNYHAGTWHHYCLALEGESDFLVVDREGPGDNCDEIQLTGDYTLKIERS